MRTRMEEELETAFSQHALSYGFAPADLGETFRIGRDAYAIVGLNPKDADTPVVGQHVATGRLYAFSELAVLRAQRRPAERAA